MIGDDYFNLRSRLGADLYTLASLIRETGGSAEDIHILDNVIASLNDPFLFVVVGEVNVGKSTFLNGLFGADISKTGVMPTTDKICFFKYGPALHTSPIGPTVDEIRVPCSFLKDFHIVDTPGTNSIENEHQQITERFVPMADLVIFVFSAMNPWGASAWHFLDKVHTHWQKNVIFVLQQADLRTAEEVTVIRDYMQQLCIQRFQREFPIFPVSAKMAFLARSTGIDRERLLQDSGFNHLEQHVDSIVMQSQARRAKLTSALRLAQRILDQMLDQNQSDLGQHVRRRQIISNLEIERTLQVERTKSKFGPQLDATDRDYRDAAHRILGIVSENFTVRKAFTAGPEDERIPGNLDHKLNHDLVHATAERWKAVATVLEDDYKHFDAFVAKQWHGEFYLGHGETISDPTDPEHNHRRFQAKIDSAFRRFVLGIRIQETLLPAATASAAQAKSLPMVAGVLSVVSGLVGWFFGWLPGLAAAGMTLAIVGVLLLRIRLTLRGAVRDLGVQLDQAREILRGMLRDQIAEETQNSYSGFDKILRPAEAQTQAQESGQQSIVSQLTALKSSLLGVNELLQSNPTA